MDAKDPGEEEQESGWSSEMEQKKVGLMRDMVEREDPMSKEVDDLMLRRFLRARNLDVGKASSMFLKYLKWRSEAVPNGYISEAQIKNQLAEKKMFVQGFDKKGRPIGVVFGSKHMMPGGQEKFAVIGDLEGWGYSNLDIRAYLASLEILQDYYPERLGKVYLVHVPYIFMAAWKIVYPFIDKNTRDKIVFVENKVLKETLSEEIDESQIPETYGGKMPLVPIQNSPSLP
ncbi:hypothetical protein MRB53_011250 [Persea americana]|uniref:Uncharacterized protein n=1 Tax=Persea americana TaxID=3435 RepID=A0ACC2LUE7_PERAE|nr:hypothetical protein MRB53_011250 [Persea americana]